jgi:hypothetical protein
VALPPDGLWEWQGDWRIDMSGRIGKNIDKDGWEYAFDFPELFARRHANRRTKGTTDCVRRRRWLRTRSSYAEVKQSVVSTTNSGISGVSSTQAEVPLFVCWDVLVTSDGSRTVTLRSCLQVANHLPYSVMVRLGGIADESAIILAPIAPQAVYDIPLLATAGSNPAAMAALCFRPADLSLFPADPEEERRGGRERDRDREGDRDGDREGGWSWSRGVSSKCRPVDGWELMDLECTPSADSDSIRAGVDSRAAPFCLLSQQTGQALRWTLFSPLQVTNALPCSAQVKCLQARPEALRTPQHARDDPLPLLSLETLSLFPASQECPKHLNLPSEAAPFSNDVYITLQVPGAGWSEPAKLMARPALVGRPKTPETAQESTLEFCFLNRSGGSVSSVLILYGHYRRYQAQTNTIDIFSKSVLVDYSGLPLHVSYQLATRRSDLGEKQVTRGVYSATQQPSLPSLSGSSAGDRHAAVSSRSCDHYPPLFLADFHVRSRRSYLMQPATEGSVVYSDHLPGGGRCDTPLYSFTALPPALHHQQYIHTPSADRNQLLRGNYWMTFRVPENAFVCVLMDKRLEARLPRWLKKEGFIKTSEQAVAQASREETSRRRTPEGTGDHEIYYHVYCRHYSSTEEVCLGSNYSPLLQPYQMYGVFVIPARERTEINARIWDQVPPGSGSRRLGASAGEGGGGVGVEAVETAWVTGGNGVTLLSDMHKNKIKVGVSSSSSSSSHEVAWGDGSLDIRGVSFNKGPFTVTDRRNQVVYHLAYQLRQLPGCFSESKEVTIIPHYCVLNTTSSVVRVRQVGETQQPSVLTTSVDAYGTSAWHRLDARMGTRVQLQVAGSLWSVGSFDVNDIGSTTLLLHKGGGRGGEGGQPGGGGSDFLVLNVEVQLAQAEDRCAVSIVIWSSTTGTSLVPSQSLSPHIPVATEASSVTSFSPLTLLNTSSASVLVQQCAPPSNETPPPPPLTLEAARTATVEVSRTHGLLLLPARSSAVYGWLHPEESSRFLSFTLNTADEVVGRDDGVPRKKKQKHRRTKSPLKTVKKAVAFKKKASKKMKDRAVSEARAVARSECLHVVIDTSKIDASSTGALYFDPSLSSPSSPDSTPASPHTHPSVVDVVLSVEWSSSGRVVRIVDRREAEAAARAREKASLNRPHSPSKYRLLSKTSGRSGAGAVVVSGSGASNNPSQSADAAAASSLSFSLDFFSIGVSLVGDTPYENCRRELLSAYLQDLHVEQMMVTVTSPGSSKGGSTCLTSSVLTAEDLQIDNYSETVVYPVMFRRDYSTPRAEDKEKALDAYSVPFFRMSYVLENSVSAEGMAGQSCYHHATVNLMPFCFEIDSGSLQLLWEDFFSKSNWFSEEEALCASNPGEWAAEYNSSLQWAWQRQSCLLHLADTKARSLQAKCLYEKLQIHPIKVCLFVCLFVCLLMMMSLGLGYSSPGFYISVLCVLCLFVPVHVCVVMYVLPPPCRPTSHLSRKTCPRSGSRRGGGAAISSRMGPHPLTS